ncbi:hypothetical protein C1I98_10950 [Spongiactinospora gelatinilytica]|uniref:Uncharacterized protein n=1 Tax=Spongiactinospora gelatinilytica TaxID=2666298 RepID=A0A2W2GJX0_9ACTN|nr:hypothetical protein [Spongiactinospora gelatinilytica]PZG49826.1 hypothetical protein C1I98_10950 [Spongiactinospora gelatinilytica]
MSPPFEDLAPGDHERIVEAVGAVVSVMTDIVHHRTADGAWQPFVERGDMASLADEARAILDALDGPIKNARRVLAAAESSARLRSYSRARRSVRRPS